MPDRWWPFHSILLPRVPSLCNERLLSTASRTGCCLTLERKVGAYGTLISLREADAPGPLVDSKSESRVVENEVPLMRKWWRWMVQMIEEVTFTKTSSTSSTAQHAVSG